MCFDVIVFTGPPTHSVGRGGGKLLTLASVCRRICNVTHQGAASDGGPIVLRPVRAKPCFY